MNVAHFAAFLKEAEPYMSVWPSKVSAFGEVVEPAGRVVAAHLRARMEANRKQLEELCRWVVPPEADVFSAAGLAGSEVACTRLVSWMLYPPNEEGIALECQRAWLAALGQRGIARQLTAPAVPRLELSTSDGRADLVLHFHQPDYLLIVEAKLFTDEHEAPSGTAQSSAYPNAVRMELGLAKTYPGALVFLTPGGVAAADTNAISETYEGLVSTVAQSLDSLANDHLTQELRWAYAAVFTHLLGQALASRGNSAATLQAVVKPWLVREKAVTDDQLLEHAQAIGRICRGFDTRRTV